MSQNHSFYIANPTQVHQRVQDLTRRSDDIKSRLALTLKKLWITERQLAVVTNLGTFGSLRTNFPNFSEVIDLFEANAIGLSRLNLPFECPPILLQGEPGLGKTLFANELAKLIGLPFFEISMATITASFALSGGSLQWSEGTVGFIANSLATSKVANPIFLIDEIDKANGNSRWSSINTFYSLLESHSAKRFRDEALEIDLDASRVIWIATANYEDMVPDPILSRMKVINIQRPNIDQMENVVASIYKGFRNGKPYGSLLAEDIEDDTLSLLVTRSPREAKLAIEEGCLKAIRENRAELLPRDIPVAIKEKNRVGFI